MDLQVYGGIIVEVIYKNGGKVVLPKNVKQIGTEDGNRRVYIEDYAYSFIKDISVDEDDDGAVGILLGEVKKSDKITYVFIKGVVEVLNAAVYTDHIAFTQETWPITKKYIAQYFGDYEILGWYLSSNKITEANMDLINKANDESFTDENSVFFMVNSESGDEAFWQRGDDGLVPMTGYTVYYEKNPSMIRYMKENQSEFDAKYVANIPSEKSEKEDDKASEDSYRSMVKEKNSESGTIKRNLTAIYALSMLVIIVVLVIGVNKINEFTNKNSTSTGGSVASDEGTQKPSKTPVTSLDSTIETTEEPTTEEPTTEEPTTEAPKEETYIVKNGDSMWGICTQFYGKYSEEYANGILNHNGITLQQLQPGMEIKIPNVN